MVQTVEQFLNVKHTDYSVIKFLYLPPEISISFSYSCNKNSYLPTQDAPRAEIIVPDSLKEFSFTVELFKTNVMAPEQTLSCLYKKGEFRVVEAKLNPSIGSKDARELHKSLGVSHKSLDKEEYVEYPAHKIIPSKSELTHIIQSITNETSKRKYSVIKIEGLSKEISVKNAFYYEGCHFIPAMSFNDDSLESFYYEEKADNIIVSFFGVNTNHPDKTLCFNPKSIKNELSSLDKSLTKQVLELKKKDKKLKKKSA